MCDFDAVALFNGVTDTSHRHLTSSLALNMRNNGLYVNEV